MKVAGESHRPVASLTVRTAIRLCTIDVMRIVELRQDHESGLQDFRREFDEAGEDHIPGFLPDSDWTFEEMVDGFAAWARGEQLPEGWVSGTTLFLEDGRRILGVVNLRHRLAGTLRQFGGHVGYSVRPSERGRGHATRMLRHVMALASEMRIERLLVTCDPKNTASIRVVQKCGGALEDEIFFEPLARPVCRFWIPLP